MGCLNVACDQQPDKVPCLFVCIQLRRTDCSDAFAVQRMIGLLLEADAYGKALMNRISLTAQAIVNGRAIKAQGVDPY